MEQPGAPGQFSPEKTQGGVPPGASESRAARLGRVLLNLATALNSAETREQAANILGKVADEIFGWDACTIDLYSSDHTEIFNIMSVDTVDGQRVVSPPTPLRAVSSMARRILDQGSEITLRQGPLHFSEDVIPFGDRSRPSASLLNVAIRSGTKVIGVFSIQSYKYNAYTSDDLASLQALADHCGGALERIRSAQELRQREERFRILSEAAPIGIFETDDQGRFTYTNDAWRRISGLTETESLGEGWGSALPTEQREAIMQQWHQTVAAGSEWSCEHKLVTPQNAVRWVRVRAKPVIGTQAGRGGYVGTVDDITEQKQAEEKLRLFTERLEQSNRELEEFASVASHDLQEPLRKISVFGERLKTKCAHALAQDGQDYIARILNAAQRMQALINELLSYSRVHRKSQPFVPVDLHKVAQDIITDLEARIEDVGGTVELQNLPAIEAEPLQMRQLLQNLIGNALKFHRPGVKPVVRVTGRIVEPCVPAEQRPNQQMLELTISDNGIGFDQQYADRLFQVFQRLHSRAEYEGTGLGLAITRRIAERHGGHVAAHGKPGEGATFIITLPLRQVASP